MVYLKSVENVITLGKLIGRLFLFCLSFLSILFLKTRRPRSPCNGNHFSSIIYIRDSQLNRPESVSLATLARQLHEGEDERRAKQDDKLL